MCREGGLSKPGSPRTREVFVLLRRATNWRYKREWGRIKIVSHRGRTIPPGYWLVYRTLNFILTATESLPSVCPFQPCILLSKYLWHLRMQDLEQIKICLLSPLSLVVSHGRRLHHVDLSHSYLVWNLGSCYPFACSDSSFLSLNIENYIFLLPSSISFSSPTPLPVLLHPNPHLASFPTKARPLIRNLASLGCTQTAPGASISVLCAFLCCRVEGWSSSWHLSRHRS